MCVHVNLAIVDEGVSPSRQMLAQSVCASVKPDNCQFINPHLELPAGSLQDPR